MPNCFSMLCQISTHLSKRCSATRCLFVPTPAILRRTGGVHRREGIICAYNADHSCYGGVVVKGLLTSMVAVAHVCEFCLPSRVPTRWMLGCKPTSRDWVTWQTR